MTDMQTISKLPQAVFTIGAKEIVKGIKNGSIKKVVVADNCPDFLIERIKQNDNIEILIFAGDQKALATALGKPFCIATVGYGQQEG